MPRRSRPLVRCGPDGGAGRILRRRQIDPGQHAGRAGAGTRPADRRHPRARCQGTPHHHLALAARHCRRRLGDRHAGDAHAACQRSRPPASRRCSPKSPNSPRSASFRDCTHAHEPGCAVQAAVAAGTLDPERLTRWRKLAEESSNQTAARSWSRGNIGAGGTRSAERRVVGLLPYAILIAFRCGPPAVDSMQRWRFEQEVLQGS